MLDTSTLRAAAGMILSIGQCFNRTTFSFFFRKNRKGCDAKIYSFSCVKQKTKFFCSQYNHSIFSFVPAHSYRIAKLICPKWFFSSLSFFVVCVCVCRTGRGSSPHIAENQTRTSLTIKIETPLLTVQTHARRMSLCTNDNATIVPDNETPNSNWHKKSPNKSKGYTDWC